MKGRLAAHGREEDSLKILPAATFVLGDTADEARERSREIALAQVRPQTAITYLEQIWNRDLSGYDPDGPLPDVEPDTGVETAQGFAVGTRPSAPGSGSCASRRRPRTSASASSSSV